MNIGLMRILDRYAGVPLCFAGSIVKRLFSFFPLSRKREQGPKNVLIIELSEMGSAILADPAMRKLKTAVKGDLFCAIFRSNSPSLELLGTVPSGNIFRMRDSGIAAIALDVIRFIFWCRKKNIDTVMDLELFSRFTALLAGLSGAVRIAGFHGFHAEGLYRGGFMTHRVSYNPHQHMAKNFIALANALLSERPEIPYSKTLIPDEEIVLPVVAVNDRAKESMREKIRQAWPAYDDGRHTIVIFNTDTSELIPVRRWPQAYYIELAEMVLAHDPRVMILLTGSIAERAEKDRIVKEVNSSRCVNFAGKTEMRELPSLYALCAFMLTNDSGPAHFASVTDMPVYVLFGPETPALYRPLGRTVPIYAGLACSPCVSATNHRKTACTDNVCLQIITPDQVFQILKTELSMLR